MSINAIFTKVGKKEEKILIGLFGLVTAAVAAAGEKRTSLIADAVADYLKSNPFYVIVVSIVFIVTAGIVVYSYLQGTKLHSEAEFDSRQKLYEEWQAKLEKLSEGIDADTMSELVGELRGSIASKASEQYLEEIRVGLLEKNRLKDWEAHIAKALSRIQEAIKDQGKRGSVNLVLGMGTAMGGIGILMFVVFTDSHQEPVAEYTNYLLKSFVPRLSIVAIIEVFAYFFLRLYKTGLAEIKYFQNEATNLESRFAAVRLTVDSGNEALLATVVAQLLATERNPLLQAGTTTLELEKERMDQTAVSLSLAQTLKVISEALPKNGDKKAEK